MGKTRQYRKSKKSRKQTRKVRKQKLWKMKGCARSKSFFCGKKFVFSGGGYFRILPEWYLRKTFKSHDYVMTYFHPRDFDKYQPLIPGLNFIRQFRSYVGIDNSAQKLEKIIVQNKFSHINGVVFNIEKIIYL